MDSVNHSLITSQPRSTLHSTSNDSWGLQDLATVGQIRMHQELNILELASYHRPKNRFVVANVLEQPLYYAEEESNSCARQCCGPNRSFQMKVFNTNGNQIMDMSSPGTCMCCCVPCCLATIQVAAPPRVLLGSVEQKFGLRPRFEVKSPTRETILQINGPFCTYGCYNDVEFPVLSADGTKQFGEIRKLWLGYVRETYSNADSFKIVFSDGLDVRLKALVMGACFLINMKYYETKQLIR